MNELIPNKNESLSKYELCSRWSIGPRSALNRRKLGRMPPYFKHGKQGKVRYFLRDIEAFEAAQKTPPKTKQ